MSRQSGDLFRLSGFRMDLIQRPHMPVLSCIDPVTSLSIIKSITDFLVDYRIFTGCFRDQLVIFYVISPVYSDFRINPVNKIVQDRVGHNRCVIVDVECSSWSDSPNQLTAFDLRFCSIHRDLNIIVYVLLYDLPDKILFQLKPGAVLPFLRDFLPLRFIGAIERNHDAVCIQLDDFEGRTFADQMLGQFQQEQLAGDADTTGHERIIQIIEGRTALAVEHPAVGRVEDQLQRVCCRFVTGLFRLDSAGNDIGIHLRIGHSREQ